MIARVAKSVRLARIVALIAAFGFIGSFSQAQSDIQTIMRNIHPVGQVCLVGQNCSGATGEAATTAAPATRAIAPAPAAAAPVPTAAAPASPAFDVAATYQLSCFACHSTGAAGAPVTGNAEAWEERMAKGMDTVLANAINGVGAMPAKGMCMTCTDDNLRSLIDFMVEGGQ